MKIHVPLELRWSDQDANHHVNNATIVTLLEEVRVRTLKDITDGLRVVRTLEVRYDGERSPTDNPSTDTLGSAR